MALRAELIHMARLAGFPPTILKDVQLWELAAALGMHRKETVEQRDMREIVETKQEYWEETGTERMERMAKVAAERKERAKKRAQERGRKRNEVVAAN